MANKGYAFMDILIGLFLLGLTTVVVLPILSFSYNNYSKINIQTEMNYLGESIYERLSSKDEYSRGIIEELTTNNEAIFSDINDEYLGKYQSKVIKLGEDDNFLEIKIIINSKTLGGNIPNVEFVGSVLK